MQIIHWLNLSPQRQASLLQRPHSGKDIEKQNQIRTIVNQVRIGGDAALRDLTLQFDQVQLDHIQVHPEEFVAAERELSAEIKEAVDFACGTITAFHLAQYPKDINIETAPGMNCRRIARPIQRVGLYVPGGSAPLISTLMMLAIPAQLAGCPLRIACSPPGANGGLHPALLYVAKKCEVTALYKIGGAQAIAAMAYGTESIPKVDKVFGPGNSWVTSAKQLVSQEPYGASLDTPAGPSEIIVVASHQADPHWVAADLLSQAEHGTDSQVILICFSEAMANNVLEEIQAQLENLPRARIAKAALTHSLIFIVEEQTGALEIINQYAPEHLLLAVEDAESWLPHIHHAGAIFLGHFTPETLGDYITGSNHVLPTYGYARNYSGLSLRDFMTWISVQEVTEEGLKCYAKYAETLARLEGLEAHRYAVAIRKNHDQSR